MPFDSNSHPILSCNNEEKYTLTFEILLTASNNRVIDLLTRDHASTQIIPSSENYIRFETILNGEHKVIIYKELTNIEFTPENRSELKEIRLRNKGGPGRRSSSSPPSGIINTIIEFDTLYDWFNDATKRCSRNKSRKKIKQRNSLKQEKIKREEEKLSHNSEINKYKAKLAEDELASQGDTYTPEPLNQYQSQYYDQGNNSCYETDQASLYSASYGDNYTAEPLNQYQNQYYDQGNNSCYETDQASLYSVSYGDNYYTPEPLYQHPISQYYDQEANYYIDTIQENLNSASYGDYYTPEPLNQYQNQYYDQGNNSCYETDQASLYSDFIPAVGNFQYICYPDLDGLLL